MFVQNVATLAHRKLQPVATADSWQTREIRTTAVGDRDMAMLLWEPIGQSSLLVAIVVAVWRTRATSCILWTWFSAATALALTITIAVTCLTTAWSAARCRPRTTAWIRARTTTHRNMTLYRRQIQAHLETRFCFQQTCATTTCRVSTNLTEQISTRFHDGFQEESRTYLHCFGPLCNVLNLLVSLNIEEKHDMQNMGAVAKINKKAMLSQGNRAIPL